MKIGQRTGLTNTYRTAIGSGLSMGAWVTRWHREINGVDYQFSYVKWDDNTSGVLSRKMSGPPSDVHFIESGDV